MKKIALTSLLAVFAASAANANVINNNPLYRPDAGQFYSVTHLGSHTDGTKIANLSEEFGYGLTDRLSMSIDAAASGADWFESGKWNNVGLGLNFRVINSENWKADVFGAYSANSMGAWNDEHNGSSWFEADDTTYTWTVGARAGFIGDDWTVAAHAAFDYEGAKSFDWNKRGAHNMRLGLDTQFLLLYSWSLIAGAEYTASYDDWSDNTGYWTGKFGANYNFDANKFVGAYVTKEMDHNGAGHWEVEDGFGFGATFGIQF